MQRALVSHSPGAGIGSADQDWNHSARAQKRVLIIDDDLDLVQLISMLLTRAGFDALQEILLDGGFIKQRHRFEDLVDTEIASEAVATLPPGR